MPVASAEGENMCALSWVITLARIYRPLRLNRGSRSVQSVQGGGSRERAWEKDLEIMMDGTHELSMRGMRDGIKLHTVAPYHRAYTGVAERMIGYSPMPCALAMVESKAVIVTWRSLLGGGRTL